MGARNLFFGVLFGIALTVYLNLQRYINSVDESQPPTPRLVAQPVSVDRTIEHSPVETLSAETMAAETQVDIGSNQNTSVEQETHRQVSTELSLKQLLQRSIEPTTVRVPTVNQLTRFETLIAQSLRQRLPDNKQLDSKLVQRWHADGWAVSLCGADNDIMVISEQPENRSGRGIYAIRLGTKSNVFLQAPHRFFDSQSGLIVRQLFQDHPIKAAAWNSVHRRQIDLSHTNHHFLNAFTRAVVTTDPASVVAQIHGFGNEKQQAMTGDVAAIISNGTRFPDRLAIATAAELKQAMGASSIRLFPNEVQQLGGTRNRQGELMRQLGASGFLHIELDSKYRDQLRKEASKRSEFFRSLAKRSKLPI